MDLLPSYMDGLCSEDSGKLVEQHLKGCADCRAFVEMLRESALAQFSVRPIISPISRNVSSPVILR